MTFDPLLINNFVMIGTAFAAAFLATLWLSLIIWTFRDIRSRTRDTLARILAVLVVALLFLPGLLIYAILRPAKTLEEEYQQTLEEETLLQTIEDIPLCPGCARKVKVNWVVCPSCQTKLKKRCHHCDQLMELPWNICPFCAQAVPGVRVETPLEEIVQDFSTIPDDAAHEDQPFEIEEDNFS